MTYRSIVMPILLLFSFASAQAQPTIEWQKAYGGRSMETPGDIVQTPDGGYAFTGTAMEDGRDVTGTKGIRDVWVVKTDHTGKLLWQKCLGGSKFDEGTSITLAKDGCLMVGGWTASTDGDVKNNDGSFDAWLVKLDNKGAILWEKTYGSLSTSGADQIFNLKPTSDGGFIFTGQTCCGISGDVKHWVGANDIWIVKTDDKGEIMWERTFGGTVYDWGNFAIETPDGGFIIVANHTNPTSVNDVHIIKLDKSGNTMWEKKYGGSKSDEAYSICNSIYGGYVFVGYTESQDGDITDKPSRRDLWWVHINDTGKILAQKCLGGSMEDYGRDVIQASDGRYIIAGYTNSGNGDVSGLHSTLYNDAWLISLYPDGSFRWRLTLGGKGDEKGYRVIQTSYGGYMLLGTVTSEDGDATNSGYEYGTAADVWLVKLSNTYDIDQVKTNPDIKVYPSPASDMVNMMLPAGYENAEISLWNMVGQKLNVEANPTGLARSIELSNVVNGNYVLQVLHQGTRSIHRVVCQH